MKSPGKITLLPEICCLIQFAEVFPEEAFVATLSRQLRWTHFRKLPHHEKEKRLL